ncbi:MAG: hypothetical protein AAB971_02710 [Patescibacteria group bacterium]
MMFGKETDSGQRDSESDQSSEPSEAKRSEGLCPNGDERTSPAGESPTQTTSEQLKLEIDRVREAGKRLGPAK